MKIKTLENIQKKESFLYYKLDFTADAIFEYGKESKEEKIPVEITIEKTALGEQKLNVIINGHINYPMLMAIKALKEHVAALIAEGQFS
jgi:hypothetical protein